MRTTTTGERTQAGASTLASFGKLEITNPDGSWVDVSTGLSTPDWLNSWQTSENIDGNTMSFQASLLRDTGTLSLCPLREDSTINRNGAGAYAPMLDVRRKWRVSTATKAQGSTPSSGDWKETGSGYIDLIDPQERPSEIRLTGRGMEAALLDAQIRIVRTYCSSGPVLVETVIQQLIDDTLGVGADISLGGLSVTGSSGITLYSPGYSPAFYVNMGYRPATGSLMDAITKLAQIAGLVVHYKYDSSNVNRLMLIQPPRNATTPDWTIGPSEYTAIPLNSIDISGVRTYIDLYYIDASLGQQHVSSPAALSGTVSSTSGSATFSVSQSGVLSNGDCILVGSALFKVSSFNGTTGCTLVAQSDGSSPTFSASAFTASDSLTRYGLRYMRVDVAGTVTLSATQAQAMADAMRSDLETPWLQQRFTTNAFWFAQLYDYGKMLANGIHYNVDQLGGVTAITQSYSGGVLKSTIDLGGQPKGRFRTWIRYGSSSVDFTGPNLTVTPTPGVTSYSIAWSGDSVTLSIDGAAYATPSASPITVPRDGSEHTYAFSGLKNGQVTGDTVTISPLGAGVTTPDLTVTPGTQTSTTQPFTVTASNPATGGGTPVITVTLHGTTGTGSSVGAIAADTPKTVPSGEVVTVNRAAFNSVPASATFKAALTGGGSETIQRTILNQDKTAFGPNLTVTVTPGASSYSIAWSGDGVLVSIDGGTAGTPAASPITVARNAPGGADRVYAFTGLKDSQTVSNVVTIPAQSGSTAPSASLVPSLTNNQTDDTVSPVTITASATNLPATYTWAIYQGYSKGQYSGTATWSGSNSSNPLTQTESVTPAAKNAKWFKLVITVGSNTYVAETQVQGLWAFLNPSTGQAATGAQDSGGRAINTMFAKPLSSSPDTMSGVPDDVVGNRYAVTVNQQSGANRAYAGLDSSSLLVTGVGPGATIAGANAAIVASGASTSLFRETCDDDIISSGRWTVVAGATPILNTGAGIVGPNIETVAAFSAIVYSEKIPYNPSKLHRIRVRIRQYADGGTQGSFFVGLRGFLASGAAANTNAGAVYVCVSGLNLHAADGWQEYTGFFIGASVASTSASSPSSNADSPAQLNANTVSISPYVVFNNAAGNGTQLIDYLEIDVLDEDASHRTYSALDTSGNAQSTMQDSTGRTINRFFGKALPGNPDTLDSALDGISYARTLAARVSSGKPWIDFSEGIHLNKTVDYIGDGATNPLAGGARGYQALDANSRLASQRNLKMLASAGPFGTVLQFVHGTSTPIAPVTSSGTSVSVTAHDAKIGSGAVVAYSSGSLGTWPAGSPVYVYCFDDTFAGGTGSSGWQATNSVYDILSNDSIYYAGQITPASSGGGGGATCPDPDEPILLADGREIRAGDLSIGDLVRTAHEETGEWGVHQVSHVQRVERTGRTRLVLTDGREIVASPSHPVYVENPDNACEVTKMCVLGLRQGMRLAGTVPGVVGHIEDAGMGPVMVIEVEGAHTYVLRGLLSHNKVPQ